jgi:enterochelin esterase family protein
VALALVACVSLEADAEVRAGAFESASLGRPVSYVVDLPPGYDDSSERYEVVYALHGLFEGEGFWERRGLARVMRQAREDGQAPDGLVVAVDGGNSFFLNGPRGRYEDLVTKDLIAHVEATYRVKPGSRHRALLGVSMGGYAALRIAFTHPDLFAAVATHSAMLLEAPPSAARGARRGHMRAFHGAFGDPIDSELWNRNDPLALAREVDPGALPALYLDCGEQDRYRLARGHRALGRILDERGATHQLWLPPGDHGYEFVRGRLPESLRFISLALGDVLPR